MTTTAPLRAHHRQFIIGPRALSVYDDWNVRQLNDEIYVSYCPALHAAWTRDADGARWALFGLAVETLAEKGDPPGEIKRTRSVDVPQLYGSWTGRWVLIGHGAVHTDASALLGCFYGKTAEGETWISSSPALMARALGGEAALQVDSRLLKYEIGVSWYTPPRSRFAEVRRLLPSQTVELRTGEIKPRPLMPLIDPQRGYEETLELLQQSLVTTLKRLPVGDDNQRPWLGLTAGFDSRLMLVLASSAKIAVKPFTRITRRMSLADRVLPPKLAHDVGYEHVYLRGSRRHKERLPVVVEHSAGHVSDGDSEPLLDGVRDTLEGISFGGHGFEAVSGFGRLRQLPKTFSDLEINARQLTQMFGEPLPSTAADGFREWLEWVQQTPHEHLDWRDRFYLEQRHAGWLSSKEQVYDLAALERFPILNAGRNYALLLGLPDEHRLGSLVQADLVRRLAPQLNKYPFNPEETHFSIFQRVLTKSSDDPLYVPRIVKNSTFAKLARIKRKAISHVDT